MHGKSALLFCMNFLGGQYQQKAPNPALAFGPTWARNPTRQISPRTPWTLIRPHLRILQHEPVWPLQQLRVVPSRKKRPHILCSAPSCSVQTALTTGDGHPQTKKRPRTIWRPQRWTKSSPPVLSRPSRCLFGFSKASSSRFAGRLRVLVIATATIGQTTQFHNFSGLHQQQQILQVCQSNALLCSTEVDWELSLIVGPAITPHLHIWSGGGWLEKITGLWRSCHWHFPCWHTAATLRHSCYASEHRITSGNFDSFRDCTKGQPWCISISSR